MTTKIKQLATKVPTTVYMILILGMIATGLFFINGTIEKVFATGTCYDCQIANYDTSCDDGSDTSQEYRDESCPYPRTHYSYSTNAATCSSISCPPRPDINSHCDLYAIPVDPANCGTPSPPPPPYAYGQPSYYTYGQAAYPPSYTYGQAAYPPGYNYSQAAYPPACGGITGYQCGGATAPDNCTHYTCNVPDGTSCCGGCGTCGSPPYTYGQAAYPPSYTYGQSTYYSYGQSGYYSYGQSGYIPPLAASCGTNPAGITIVTQGNTVSWQSNVTGGVAPYTLSWANSDGQTISTGSTQSVTFVYNSLVPSTQNVILTASSTDGQVKTVTCTETIRVTLAPWVQTNTGDVHSNTKVNTPGGP
jgi:hypothetical protein